MVVDSPLIKDPGHFLGGNVAFDWGVPLNSHELRYDYVRNCDDTMMHI